MAVGEPLATEAADELLSFEPLEDGTGVEIIDHIERRRVAIKTPNLVDPQSASSDLFEYPVQAVVSIETDQILITNQLNAIVRNSLGFMVAEVNKGEKNSFPPDTYNVDPGAPIKTYLGLDSSFSLEVTGEGVRISLPSVSEVYIGARSHHKKPAATIETTHGVDDLMTAISYFGSALKTTTCERSYPSLRGHPPIIKIGTGLEVPSVLDRPDTGITIEVPEEIESIFTVSTLAYYLGAEVRAGANPRIVTTGGFEHALGNSTRGFESEVERVLKQVFFLDCLTRTEGFFQVNLHERNQIEADVALDFTELYDEPVSTQIESYLHVPYHQLRPYIPPWKLSAHITPDPINGEFLPFFANELALIHPVDERNIGRERTGFRGRETLSKRHADRPTHANRPMAESVPTSGFVSLEATDTMEQVWVGNGTPLGATKAIQTAYFERLGRTPNDRDINISVVCNSTEMGQEWEMVNDVYGSRGDLPFDVSIHTELTKSKLRAIFEKDIEFLHYIGHIDSGGFECTNGRLDAASLEFTGVDIFFLNSCTSYVQGHHLIEAGSIAGVVTFQDVINSGAQRVGSALARLLNGGFPLGAALEIARTESIMGGVYVVIGDGGMEIAQPQGHVPALCNVRKGRNRWNVEYITYPTDEEGLGTIVIPALESCDEFYLASGNTGTFELTETELIEFLGLEEMPVRMDEELYWSGDFPALLDQGPE